jgi:hypothetical protein
MNTTGESCERRKRREVRGRKTTRGMDPFGMLVAVVVEAYLFLPTALTGLAHGCLFGLSGIIGLERFGIKSFSHHKRRNKRETTKGNWDSKNSPNKAGASANTPFV